MRKRMLQLNALPAVGISVLPKPILRSSASAGDPTRVVSSSSRAGAAPSSLRSRRPSPSPAPTPPSAPILGLLLRPTDCAKERLDSLLHLLPNHVADHRDQTPSSRHATSLAWFCRIGRLSDLAASCYAQQAYHRCDPLMSGAHAPFAWR